MAFHTVPLWKEDAIVKLGSLQIPLKQMMFEARTIITLAPMI